MPNSTLLNEERRLNHFGTAVLVWYGKRVCRTFVELNLGSTHGTPSESDVAPVSLQSRTYSVRFGTWKVRRLNQALESLNFILSPRRGLVSPFPLKKFDQVLLL